MSYSLKLFSLVATALLVSQINAANIQKPADLVRMEMDGDNVVFSSQQLKALKELSDFLLNSELEEVTLLPRAPASASYQQRNMQFQPQMSKRNSELLNSLLGLPKNILKSGRR